MIRHIDKSVYHLTILSFSSIYHGREVKVTVCPDKGSYGVQLDDVLVGEVDFDEHKYAWYLCHGELDDTDLVYEIGERIEARYN
jgi:hypothetical protein